jgi:hypothetical protein
MFEIQQKLLPQRFKISGYEIFIAWITHLVGTRVELLPGFKFTSKMVKKNKFTGKIGKKW